ncbi:hypothetical protein AOXY_G3664 [Acipenser oxyrinchus oxyrinchus]|uniref:Uncharacterized protein n=1 Tax=Acipenser oxyrinchus oxyrinchus TaxID=40147 RepID=A0AAD8GFV6_ACIOX|nr:hypothetical protein AOXY_G3664 [Acipenser oxyrinchus oxyrinchus]
MCIAAAIQTYWYNVTRKIKEADIWDSRLKKAKRRKLKHDKCLRRLKNLELAEISTENKDNAIAAFKTLPLDLTVSSEESGEENDPFNDNRILI